MINHLRLPSPLQKISPSGFDHINLYIKRDDLIHPHISGNKWRKLQKTISEFDRTRFDSIITFGGPFSNHLIATAVACSLHKIKCSAFVRSEKIDPQNPTLNLCTEYGMELIPLPKAIYAQRTNNNFITEIHRSHPRTLVIPEGGFHVNALEGVGIMMQEIKNLIIDPDTYLVSLGTGCTAAGIIDNLGNSKLWISPAIKQFTPDAMMQAHQQLSEKPYPRKQVEVLYHEQDKAYAKKDILLFEEIQSFLQQTGVLLDPIYTGKAWRLLRSKVAQIPSGSNIVWIHTGGLQAWKGYFYRYPFLKQQFKDIYELISKEV